MNLKEKVKDDIAKFFNVKFYQKGNIPVPCPFHNDFNASASLHLQKELFHCFKSGCVGGLNFKQLTVQLKKEQSVENEEVIEERSETMNTGKSNNGHRQLLKGNKTNFETFIKRRGVSLKTLKELGAYPVYDA